MPAKDVLGSTKVVINSKSVRGEPGTGYEGSNDLGEFECANCKYFRDGGCNQKDMKKLSKQPKLPDGRVQVDPEGCCDYVTRVGKPDKDK